MHTKLALMVPSKTLKGNAEAGSVSLLDRRRMMIGGILAVGAGISHFGQPQVMASPISKAQFSRLIPDRVGRWQSRRSDELVVATEDEGQDKLYENIETRIYEGRSLPSIMLLVAYSSIQRNDIQVHRPEVCYPAGGFPIEKMRSVAIEFNGRGIDALELVADRGGLKEKILYWIRVGDEFPAGWVDLRLKTAMSNITGIIPDGLLFRVSTVNQGSDFSTEELIDFSKAFVAAAPPSLKKVVLF